MIEVCRNMKKLDIILFIIALIILIFSPDNYNEKYKCFIGIYIVIVSCRLAYKYRNDRYFSVMFSIVLYINFSLVMSDCFTDGVMSLPDETLSWQKYRGTIYELIFLNGLCLFWGVVNVICYSEPTNVRKKIIKKDNVVVFALSMAFGIFILFNGYEGEVGTSYVSNTTALYEYGLMFFLLTWYYSGESTGKEYCCLAYAGAYIVQAIYYGDRSSAFPMILLLFTIYFENISLKKIFTIALVGILMANTIAVYRESYSLSNFINDYFNRYGFVNIASDTVSQSYYTGVSLMAVKDMLSDTSSMVVAFMWGILLGGNIENANVTEYGKMFATNKGGGLFVSDFLFWFGYYGAVVSGICIAFYISKMQKYNHDFRGVWKLYFTITIFRWYLYTAFDLFRGVFFVFPIVYVFYRCLDKVTMYFLLRIIYK